MTQVSRNHLLIKLILPFLFGNDYQYSGGWRRSLGDTNPLEVRFEHLGLKYLWKEHASICQLYKSSESVGRFCWIIENCCISKRFLQLVWFAQVANFILGIFENGFFEVSELICCGAPKIRDPARLPFTLWSSKFSELRPDFPETVSREDGLANGPSLLEAMENLW